MFSKKSEEHSFSAEMKSEHCVKKMSFQDDDGIIFFEGFLGKLVRVSLVEDLMLQIEGANGVLRVDIDREDLETCLKAQNPSEGKKP